MSHLIIYVQAQSQMKRKNNVTKILACLNWDKHKEILVMYATPKIMMLSCDFF